MNRKCRFSFSRALGVLVLLAAWLVLSNHCALAVIGHGAAAATAAELHHCCPGNAVDGDGRAPDQRPWACCKMLRVLLADAGTKLVHAPDWSPLDFSAWVAVAVIPPVERPKAKGMSTTGPPRAWSFAEAVLQRSLLGHAPPTLA